MTDDHNQDANDDAQQAELKPAEILAELSKLREAHRRLDDEVTALQTQGVTDMMKIARMKKMKLKLKDRIAHMSDMINPDIIA